MNDDLFLEYRIAEAKGETPGSVTDKGNQTKRARSTAQGLIQQAGTLMSDGQSLPPLLHKYIGECLCRWGLDGVAPAKAFNMTAKTGRKQDPNLVDKEIRYVEWVLHFMRQGALRDAAIDFAAQHCGVGPDTVEDAYEYLHHSIVDWETSDSGLVKRRRERNRAALKRLDLDLPPKK